MRTTFPSKTFNLLTLEDNANLSFSPNRNSCTLQLKLQSVMRFKMLNIFTRKYRFLTGNFEFQISADRKGKKL